MQPVPFTNVRLNDTFWSSRQAAMRTVGLPYQYSQLLRQGCPNAFRWKPGEPDESGRFRDSDIAKWIEAASYSLATHPDPNLERLIDDYVATLAPAQQADGYINSYYGLVHPERKYTNLRDNHEIYRMGHMMEAAVAYHAATGKRAFLDIMIRCANGMALTFGRDGGKRRGYCGHEEVEMALVKLYRATGDDNHLRLAEYFVNERGQRPHDYEAEAAKRGEPPKKDDFSYFQAHKPVREQDRPVGHAVRALYLYAGMADVARETGDATLLPPLKHLWQEITKKYMYLTGGVGSTIHGEKVTFPYDLPNDTAYAETCAAIALAFWGHRMLQLEPHGDYADVMERALYNGMLSGVALSGDRYFYANPLAAFPGSDPHDRQPHGNPKQLHRRVEWFDCPCCPPNLARVVASIGGYAYGVSDAAVWIHLYVAGKVNVGKARLAVDTQYPWEGRIQIRVTEGGGRFALKLRIPCWCKNPSLTLNGIRIVVRARNGYTEIKRLWKQNDVVTLSLPMDIQFVESHPAVWRNAGRVALQRGPLLYCLEEADNGPWLTDLILHKKSLKAIHKPRLLGGVTVLRGKATTRIHGPWAKMLYASAPSRTKLVNVTAIPYYAWANRAPGNMLVWVQAQ